MVAGKEAFMSQEQLVHRVAVTNTAMVFGLSALGAYMVRYFPMMM